MLLRKAGFSRLLSPYKQIKMKIICNGESIILNNDCTAKGLLAEKELSEKRGIAVAVNDHVIPRNEWETYLLKENDNVLIITAAQGG